MIILHRIKTTINSSYSKLSEINSKKSEHLNNVQIGDNNMS